MITHRTIRYSMINTTNNYNNKNNDNDNIHDIHNNVSDVRGANLPNLVYGDLAIVSPTTLNITTLNFVKDNP